MKIAFLLHQFPALSETFILRQVTGLLDRGHDVRIFAEYPGQGGPAHGDVARYALDQRTHYLGIPYLTGMTEMPVWPLTETNWDPYTGEEIPNGARLAKAVPLIVSCRARWPELTRQVMSQQHYGHQALSLSALHRMSALAALPYESFDVLHSHFGPVGSSFRFARKLWNAPLVVSFHGYDFSTWPSRFGAHAYEGLFAESEIITAHTEYASDKLRELGCPDNLVRRLPCGIDLTQFASIARPASDSPLRVATVGRLVEKKGYATSIQALAMLAKRGIDFRYQIVGTGPLRDSLRALAAEGGISDRVEFVGPKSGEEVRALLQQSDVFLLPSVTATDGDTEGAPVSLMEAQTCGLPVVSTLHAGIPEIVADNQSGILVPEHDVEQTAAALIKLACDSALRARMGEQGRANMQRRHDIQQLNDQLVDYYNEAIGIWNRGNRLAKPALSRTH